MLQKVDLKTGLTNSVAANCDHRSRGQCLVYAFAFSCDIMYPEKIHQKHYTQIWVVTDYQYGISAAIPEMSFLYETSTVVVLQNVCCFFRLDIALSLLMLNLP